MHEDGKRGEEVGELARRLGLAVNDLMLYDRALTHASIASEAAGVERARNYESLEFLGDAVLGLVVAHHLFERAPGRTPGEYSRMRAGVVNSKTLAGVAQRLEIAPAIRLGKGEELSGGRRRTALLADCLEALIGAIYLDQGWEATREFVGRVFARELDEARELDTVWDYKSRLQHLCQSEHRELPRFIVARSEGPDHQKRFEVEVYVGGACAGRGAGRSKKEAEQNAAREALKREGIRVD